MMEHVLACNAGSSSLKLSLFAGSPAQGWALINTVNLPAVAKPSGSNPALENSPGGNPSDVNPSDVKPAGTASYTKLLSDWLQPLSAPDRILHRVVHAGLVPEQAAPLNEDTLALIRHWLPMAPRHNALTLELIEALQQRWPHLPQFAIYDSGLYANLPEHAARYALPEGLSPQWPLRRYGFHGLAHRSQWRQVQAMHGKFPWKSRRQATVELGEFSRREAVRADKVISVHLGSGVSITAWRDGDAVDTSMGFSPLEGLIMARRSGSLDPGMLMHLLLREDMSPEALDKMLHEHSGLAALAGHDGDMQAILEDMHETGSKTAAAAVTQYCYQIRKTIGSYIAALGGVDAISFGGGVAEHQALIRQ
ncbi:MAG: hypothetical protein KKD00_00750, partial [Gammaproteobacteria bacterium]|nr:hypothetical protein [Gammaproteobacteria bacterium]